MYPGYLHTISVSVVTAVLTTLLTKGLPHLFMKCRERRKFAFTLRLGIGEVWHLRKDHS